MPVMDRWGRQNQASMRQRLALAGTAILLPATAALFYSYAVEPRRLQQRHFRLGVSDLPPGLVGVSIAHLTDFHVGMANTHRPMLRRAIAVAAAWQPDIVVLTGDFVHAGRWEPGAALFADLARTAPTFAVLGNHDHRASPTATERIVAALRAQGVQVMGNEHRVVPLRNGSAELVLVAVDDPSQGRDDLAAAMAGLPAQPERDRPTVLLGHAPEIVDRAPASRFALTLAGHTHGGQLRFSPFKRRTPLDLPMIAGGLDSPYARGTHLVNGNPLFVNSGLGVSGVPFRFLAPPQVARFVLAAGVDESKEHDDPARYLIPIPEPSDLDRAGSADEIGQSTSLALRHHPGGRGWSSGSG